MNFTEELIKKIEAEKNEAAKTKKQDDFKVLLEAVIRNPWSKKDINVTRQIVVAELNPGVAKVLKENAEVALSYVLPLLPKEIREAFTGTKGVKEE